MSEALLNNIGNLLAVAVIVAMTVIAFRAYESKTWSLTAVAVSGVIIGALILVLINYNPLETKSDVIFAIMMAMTTGGGITAVKAWEKQPWALNTIACFGALVVAAIAAPLIDPFLTNRGAILHLAAPIVVAILGICVYSADGWWRKGLAIIGAVTVIFWFVIMNGLLMIDNDDPWSKVIYALAVGIVAGTAIWQGHKGLIPLSVIAALAAHVVWLQS